MDVNEDIMSRLQKQVDDYYNPKQKQVDDHNKPKRRTKVVISKLIEKLYLHRLHIPAPLSLSLHTQPPCVIRRMEVLL